MTERKLVGFDNFVRHNPLSDKFEIIKFHHLEFYTADAISCASRFTWGMGMHMVAKSDLSTGKTGIGLARASRLLNFVQVTRRTPVMQFKPVK
jgi:hypothetical protein